MAMTRPNISVLQAEEERRRAQARKSRVGSDPAPPRPPQGGAVGTQPGIGYMLGETAKNALGKSEISERIAPMLARPAIRAVTAAAPILSGQNPMERPLEAFVNTNRAIGAAAGAAFNPPAPPAPPKPPMAPTPAAATPASPPAQPGGPAPSLHAQIMAREEQARLRGRLRDEQEGFRYLAPADRDAARGRMDDLRNTHRGISAQNTPVQPAQTPEQVAANRASLGAGDIFGPTPSKAQLDEEFARRGQMRADTIEGSRPATARVLAEREERERERRMLASRDRRLQEAQVGLVEAQTGAARQRAEAEAQRFKLDARQAQSENAVADVVLPAQEKRAAAEAVKANTPGWAETVTKVVRAVADNSGRDPSEMSARVLSDAIAQFEGLPEEARALAASEILTSLEAESPGLSLDKSALEDSGWRWLKWLTALSPANLVTDTGAMIDSATGASQTQVTINDLLKNLRGMRDRR